MAQKTLEAHVVHLTIEDTQLNHAGIYFLSTQIHREEQKRTNVLPIASSSPTFDSPEFQLTWYRHTSKEEAQDHHPEPEQLMFKVFEILDPNTGGDPETSNPREGESAEDTATLIGVAGFNLNVEYIGYTQSMQEEIVDPKTGQSIGQLSITLQLLEAKIPPVVDDSILAPEPSDSPVKPTGTLKRKTLLVPPPVVTPVLNTTSRPFTSMANATEDTLEICIRFGTNLASLLLHQDHQRGPLETVSQLQVVVKVVTRQPTKVSEVDFEYYPESLPYDDSVSPFSTTKAVNLVNDSCCSWNEVLILTIPSAAAAGSTSGSWSKSEALPFAGLRFELIEKHGPSCDLRCYWTYPLTTFIMPRYTQHFLTLGTTPYSSQLNQARVQVSLTHRPNEISNFNEKEDLTLASSDENENEKPAMVQFQLDRITLNGQPSSVNVIAAISILDEQELVLMNKHAVTYTESSRHWPALLSISNNPQVETIASTRPLMMIEPGSIHSSTKNDDCFSASSSVVHLTPEGSHVERRIPNDNDSSTSESPDTQQQLVFHYPALFQLPPYVDDKSWTLRLEFWSRKNGHDWHYLDSIDHEITSSSMIMSSSGQQDNGQIVDRSSTEILQISGQLRCWSRSSWTSVCARAKTNLNSHEASHTYSNRQQIYAPALAPLLWMDPLRRGLSRQNVSTIVPLAGLPGVLIELLEIEIHKQHRDAAEEASLLQKRQEVKDQAELEWCKTRMAQYQVDHAQMQNQLDTCQDDMRQKKILVDRLLSEIDRRTSALKSCGAEIVELRKAQAFQRSQLTQCRLECDKAREREDRRAATTTPGAKFWTTPEDLAGQFTELQSKFHRAQERLDVAQLELAQAQAQARALKELQQRHDRLERAHVVQADFVQKLQRDQHKVAVYKATVKTQEQVIEKLEHLIETKLAQFQGGQICHPNPNPNPNQNLELEELRAENARLLLLPDRSSPRDSKTTQTIRIQVLEEQLVRNAQAAAEEISELKFQLLEIELGTSPTENRPSNG